MVDAKTSDAYVSRNMKLLARSINETTITCSVLNIEDHLHEITTVEHIHRIILTEMRSKKAGTLYLIGHRGTATNSGGIVTKIMDKTTGKQLVLLKGGFTGADLVTETFLIDIKGVLKGNGIGMGAINIVSCGGGGESSGVTNLIAGLNQGYYARLAGSKVAGSVETIAPWDSGDIDLSDGLKLGTTFGVPRSQLYFDNKEHIYQKRWEYTVKWPPPESPPMHK